MAAIDQEKNDMVAEADSPYEIDQAIMLRIRQLGDAGLRAAMQKLKAE